MNMSDHRNGNKIGRPKLLEDEVRRAEVCALIAVGCSRATAARYVGVHPDTIRRAACRNEQFAAELVKAESKHEINQLMNINQAARSDRYWRAAAWTLERKYPDQYRPRRAETITLGEISSLIGEVGEIVAQAMPAKESADHVRERFLALIDRLHSNGLKHSPGPE